MSDFAEAAGELKRAISETSTVVVKLGTGVLTPHIEKNDLNYFIKLAGEIDKIRRQGKRVIVVSSGAVGFGRRILARQFETQTAGGEAVDKAQQKNKKSGREPLAEKQALASLGQTLLIETYRKTFEEFRLEVAQILVSILDFQSRSHFQHLKNTLDQLMSWGAVPVINENDAVAVEGLKFGDNDTLSALIAGMYPQSMLLILTTVDGYYHQGERVDLLGKVEAEHLKSAGKPAEGGMGGMKTKLIAARKILMAGQFMNIAAGEDPANLARAMAGENIGTWFFAPSGGKINAKKRWLLHNRHVSGKLTIDAGALEALKKTPASLLTVGVLQVEGKFTPGDVVEIVDSKGVRVGRGIASIGSSFISSVVAEAGSGTGTTRGERRGQEAVHRDNLILLED